MKTAPVTSFCSEKKIKKERPYYLTRQKTPEELAIIEGERRRTKKLLTGCVSTGIGVALLYFVVKWFITRGKAVK